MKKWNRTWNRESLAQQPYTTIASWYDLLDYYWEKARYQHARKIVWAMVKGGDGAGGRKACILDAGVGTGRNMPYYPPNAKVEAIDLSGRMLAQAAKRAKKLGLGNGFLGKVGLGKVGLGKGGIGVCNVGLHHMDVTDLKFGSRSFDAIVSTFVLCVLSPEKEARALAEFHRVLKPGGRLILLDYTYSRRAVRRMVQRFFSPLIRALYGTRLDNPTVDLVSKRFRLDSVQFLHADTLRMILASKLPPKKGRGTDDSYNDSYCLRQSD